MCSNSPAIFVYWIGTTKYRIVVLDKIRDYREKVPKMKKKIFRTGYKKKCLGLGVKIMHGQATGTTHIFCFGLIGFWINSLTIPETKIAKFAPSIDLDEVAHDEPPHLELHCLPSRLSSQYKIAWALHVVKICRRKFCRLLFGSLKS